MTTMTAPLNPDLAEGARILLVNCAGVNAGDRVLILYEDPTLGWYDRDTPMTVAAAARALGATTTALQVGAPDNDRDPMVAAAIAVHDCTIFFARIGDQDRFADPAPGKTCVMCYARDTEILASPYGRSDYRAFEDLKNAVNALLFGAESIEITCPLGTSISGRATDQQRKFGTDVAFHRFPLGVPQPLEAAQFSGRVAIAHYLTPTGSKVYEPASMAIDSPVFAEVTLGRVSGITGNARVVAQVCAHTDMVAKRFGIDGDVVHSWHAGIHPGCDYTADAADDPDRWSNTVFTNPRFLHFHTCATYPPGEICWMVRDPTVAVDGVSLWESGRLRPEAFAVSRDCLVKWPELKTLFAKPAGRIGLPE